VHFSRDDDGRVARLELAGRIAFPCHPAEAPPSYSFLEPPDYIPREAWYRQFEGRGLDPDLDLKRAIRPVTGATLTARATTSAVRRVLALHRVIHPTVRGAARGAAR